MKKTLLTVFLLVLFTFSYGQENSEKIRITTTPMQFFFYDFPISVEKRFNRHTVGLTFAYRPDTKNGGEVIGGHGVAGDYSIQNFWNPLYEAVTFGINSKYYFVKGRNFYLDARLFYRHWWFDNKYASYPNDEGYRFEGLRTERQDVFGLKFLIGHTFIIETKGNLHPLIDVYFGLGTRYKTEKFITQNGTVYDIYYDNLLEKNSYWIPVPTPHLGVRVGVVIK